MIKILVLGVEGSAGVGAKSGKAYDMGKLFTTAPLAPPMGQGVALGVMGMELQCVDSSIPRSLEKCQFPVECDADIRTVMRFGKAEQLVFSAKPVAGGK